MIWGRTNAQWIAHVTERRLWFAWHPVLLRDGRWAWLEYVWRFRRSWNNGREVSGLWTYDATGEGP